MRWVGRVARMGAMSMRMGVQLEHLSLSLMRVNKFNIALEGYQDGFRLVYV